MLLILNLLACNDISASHTGPPGTIQTYAHQVPSAAELCYAASADGACLAGRRESDPLQSVFTSIEIGGPHLSRTRYLAGRPSRPSNDPSDYALIGWIISEHSDEEENIALNE